MMEDEEMHGVTFANLMTLDQNQVGLYVLNIPALEVEGTIYQSKDVLALAVFTRSRGVLLCLPQEALPAGLIVSQAPIDMEEMVGPSKVIQALAVEIEEDGNERLIGQRSMYCWSILRSPCSPDFDLWILPKTS